ncbi:MAG TPA: hypothetical protein VKB36_04810 [Vicinamibacterales bacterium]|nr:hypothetical protein [Vicinamibacterales bacterium]
MTQPARNLAGGLVVAVLLATPFVFPHVGRIDTWKILLAIAGLALIRYGDRAVKR